VQFSPDGEWFWDGAQWRAAYSPDRLWRWDGRQWVSAGPRAVSWRFEPTPWTRRLQFLLLLKTMIAAGVVLTLVVVPQIAVPVMQQSFDRALAAQPNGAAVDPQQLRAVMMTALYASLGVGAIVGGAALAVVVVGILKLWRWVYWYLAVSYLLALLGIPQSLIYAIGSGPVGVPAIWLFFTVPLALAEGALGVWMIVLYRRYRTWARRWAAG
jgi:hypothetical protein